MCMYYVLTVSTFEPSCGLEAPSAVFSHSPKCARIKLLKSGFRSCNEHWRNSLSHLGKRSFHEKDQTVKVLR